MSFTLAVCSEMAFTELPLLERIKRIDDLGFAAEIWGWTDKDPAALAGTGARFTSMTGYVEGDLITPDGADALLRTAEPSIAFAREIGCPTLNIHGTGLGEGGLPVRPVEVVTGPMWLAALRTLERVAELAGKDRAAVIFDLDDTLFDSRVRTAFILREVAGARDFTLRFPLEAALVARLKIDQIAYDIGDSLHAIGIGPGPAADELKAQWLQWFFNDAFCDKDYPVLGAPEYVRRLVLGGAHVIYLTGRDEPRMGDCTLRAVLRYFPLGEDGEIVMKPSRDLDDVAFKRGAFARVRGIWNVVGAFENEPRNINMMKQEFPDAQAVFLDTIHSKNPEQPDPSIPWIRDFLD
jgi:hydroxypyruvate isomerase